MEKLLLVEDDPTLIRMLTSFLSDENFLITSVTGQQAAAAAMESDKPDLALVDISLAEGNGFAVCGNAKALGVPVIFLTASGLIDQKVPAKAGEAIHESAKISFWKSCQDLIGLQLLIAAKLAQKAYAQFSIGNKGTARKIFHGTA